MKSVAVVGTALLGGLLFAPLFGLSALLVPVGVPALAVLAVALICGRGGAGTADWRPVLTALAGVLATAETVLWPTTVAGLPTAATLRGLADGVTVAWWRTLETTWPARPEPGLLIFVPLLVVSAAVIGLELLHRLTAPLPALLPGLALLVFAQAHITLAIRPAVLVGLVWAGLAGLLLASARTVVLLPVAASAAGAAVLAGVTLPAAPPRVSLHAEPALPPESLPVTSPLDELTGRLADPAQTVFRVRSTVVPDRWPVIVLDSFDGVNWTPGDSLRRLGAKLEPGIRVPVVLRSAAILNAPGPWLPSQTSPASVDGAVPYVATRTGSLLLPGPVDYTLRWWEPQVTGDALFRSGVDERAPHGLDPLRDVPAGLADLAMEATGRQPPSFRSALLLEEWFRSHYRLAAGADRPAGHGWPQLTEFLRTTRRGTSEQFAAAYVVLARLAGIPARLAVGFRTPARPDADGGHTIRNGDALAWPEVAVAGAGWVPLDPSGPLSDAEPTGAAAAAEAARAVAAQHPAGASPTARSVAGTPSRHRPWTLLLALPAAILLWPVAVPTIWTVRAWRRRRGAVTNAEREARDRLRSRGVPVTRAMTLRDLADAVPRVANELRRLGEVIDRAAWSGAEPSADDHRAAWSAVYGIRLGLTDPGLKARWRAMTTLRGLRAGHESEHGT